jgi:hypothetical protein
MQIHNGRSTWNLDPPVFGTLAEAEALRGKVNSDLFCGFPPGTLYMSRLKAVAVEGGFAIVSLAYAVPVTAKWPSADFGAVLRPQEVLGDRA